MSEQGSSNTQGACNIEERLEGELSKIRREVDDLYETVYKGNGVPSLVTRANNMESKLSGLREIMNDKINHISSENALRFESINDKIDSKFTRLEGWIETKLSSVEMILHKPRQLHPSVKMVPHKPRRRPPNDQIVLHKP